MLDRKGIFSFLIITFGVTYLVEGLLLLGGARFELDPANSAVAVVGAVMLVPAVAAWVTIQFVTREGFANTGLRFGSWKPYLATWLLMPACFALIYLATWALGLGQPDWQFSWFMQRWAASGATPPDMPPTALILGGLFLASLGPSPLSTCLFTFGEDFGWRGYLLPKLMPLGKPAAYTLSGLIWSMWHWPLVLGGFVYPGQPWLGLFFFTLLAGALGVMLNELTVRYRSCLLPSWVHALFNTQKQGIWFLLFPAINPFWGGYAGVIGLGVWGLLAAGILWFYARRRA